MSRLMMAQAMDRIPPLTVGRMEAAPKFSVLLLSGILAAAIPLVLSLYWIAFWLAPESVGGPLRILVLGCSFALGLFWYRARLSHAEVLLFRVLGAAAVAWLIPTLLATEPSHAIGGWLKFITLFAMCCFAVRGLRHPPTATVFGVSLIAGALCLGLFILFFYVKSLGFTIPTYKVAREFKGIAEKSGMPLNSIAFAAVFSYFMGLCLLKANRWLVLLGVPIVALSSVFTGSRAPLVIMAASVSVLLGVNGLRSNTVLKRLAAAFVGVVAVVALVVVAVVTPDGEMNHATEGRSHLWSVGIAKFIERPLFGYGYESWRDDLVSRLPGENDLTFDLAQRLGGGYHNEYVSVLAEEGLIGAVAALLIIGLLLRSSYLLSFRQWRTVCTGQWPWFAAIFLLLRANFEVPGLFGYGQDPVDYLAYLFLAIVVSRFSIEEDYALASLNGSRA